MASTALFYELNGHHISVEAEDDLFDLVIAVETRELDTVPRDRSAACALRRVGADQFGSHFPPGLLTSSAGEGEAGDQRGDLVGRFNLWEVAGTGQDHDGGSGHVGADHVEPG